MFGSASIHSRFLIYQKIKDIYTTSIDYEPKNEKTIEFFKVVVRPKDFRPTRSKGEKFSTQP